MFHKLTKALNPLNKKALINRGMGVDLDSGLKIEANKYDEYVSGVHAKIQSRNQ